MILTNNDDVDNDNKNYDADNNDNSSESEKRFFDNDTNNYNYDDDEDDDSEIMIQKFSLLFITVSVREIQLQGLYTVNRKSCVYCLIFEDFVYGSLVIRMWRTQKKKKKKQ